MRSECGDATFGGNSCYCYQPVKPLILEPDEGDKRPRLTGWAISAREHAVGIADFVLKATKIRNKKFVLYWDKDN